MVSNQHILDGAWAEQISVDFLQGAGYLILHRNWRNKRAEVDIICEKEERLIFVEVKYRRNNYFGDPETAISEAKVGKLQEAAEAYLEQDTKFEEVFFDIISITGPREDAKLVHYPDAFFPH